jgi:hypothetical protein
MASIIKEEENIGKSKTVSSIDGHMHPKGYTIIDDTVVIKALIGINK